MAYPAAIAAKSGRKLSHVGMPDDETILRQQMENAIHHPNAHTLSLLAHNPLLIQTLMDPSKTEALAKLGLDKIFPQLKQLAKEMDAKGAAGTTTSWDHDNQLVQKPTSLTDALKSFETALQKPQIGGDIAERVTHNKPNGDIAQRVTLAGRAPALDPFGGR